MNLIILINFQNFVKFVSSLGLMSLLLGGNASEEVAAYQTTRTKMVLHQDRFTCSVVNDCLLCHSHQNLIMWRCVNIQGSHGFSCLKNVLIVQNPRNQVCLSNIRAWESSSELQVWLKVPLLIKPTRWQS